MSIGIIANPASGKDIRRLVSYATVIDNNEKVNIVKRIILAAQGMGIKKVYYMPDTFQIGEKVVYELNREKVLKIDVLPIDMDLNGVQEDSTIAAKKLEELGVGGIVVLGGDGTSRAVAKGIKDVPILPVSTGTNNVYPTMLEGTVAGMAVAAASLIDEPLSCCSKDKIIEVYLNGEFKDIALIDAVHSTDIFVGSRAIWDMDKIKSIVVARCHPASIGFSAIAGAVKIIEDYDDKGLYIELKEKGTPYRAAIAAGVVEKINIGEEKELPLDEELEIKVEERGMIALDGEREVKVEKGDVLTYKITRNGPWKIDSREILEKGKEIGLYKI